MNLREYYNKLVSEYLENKKISFKHRRSKYSDYYYVLNIKGKDNHTLKVRISNHRTKKNFEIPFCNFWYTKYSNKWNINNQLGSYIARHRYKNIEM